MTDWYKIKRILVGTKQVYPAAWKPWANTILYVPMENNLLDHSSNHFTLTNSWVALAQNQANIPVWNFNGSAYLSWANRPLFNFRDFHLWCWLKLATIAESQFVFGGASSWDAFFGYQTFGGNNRLGVGRNGVAWDSVASITLNANEWYYICYDRQWSTFTISCNWTTIWTSTNSNNYVTSWWFRIGDDWEWYNIYWYMSEFILENKARTTEERSEYYNLTKWNYWL